jgi:hypothetical protein
MELTFLYIPANFDLCPPVLVLRGPIPLKAVQEAGITARVTAIRAAKATEFRTPNPIFQYY